VRLFFIFSQNYFHLAIVYVKPYSHIWGSEVRCFPKC